MSLEKSREVLNKKARTKTVELISGCRANDRKSQFEIYKRYYKAMYNTSYRILNNNAEAEDVMQESFLDAFRKIEQYEGSATFGAWLKRIVINKSLDQVRKKWNTEQLETADENIPDNTEEENAVEVLSYKIDLIRNGIEMLPDRYRVVLSLFLLEGYDHQEISQIMGIGYNATRTLYSRAKRRLLDSLKKNSHMYKQ